MTQMGPAASVVCARCGEPAAAGMSFCGHCGQSLREAMGPERRVVTVAFCDISGFTGMSERLEPDEVQAVMNRVLERSVAIVEARGGRVDKFMGDAILALFGDPVAHEDDPDRAVQAVLEVHAALEDMAGEIEGRVGVRLRFHSGINTGLVAVGGADPTARGNGVLGDTVNTAARLQALAEPGQLLIGPETRAQLRAPYLLVDLGSKTLKGKAEPVVVTQVTGRMDQAPRPRRGRFFGRETELACLVSGLAAARAGRSAAVAILGEPGCGKSRLVEQLRGERARGVEWVEAASYPETAEAPYGLVRELLRPLAGLTDDEGAERLHRRLEGLVGDGRIGGAAADALGLLLGLAEVQPAQAERFEEDLAGCLIALAGRGSDGPLVVCAQDLHWCDPASLRLLARLANAAVKGVMVLTTSRSAVLGGVDSQVNLTVDRLGPDHADALVASLLGSAVSPELCRYVEARTEGNPFFLEELVSALREGGRLVAGPRGWRLSGEDQGAVVPGSVRAVLASRMDHLDPSRRQLLREASVVGRQFLASIVRQVATAPADCPAALSDLELGGFVSSAPLAADVEYLFKHALTQEVAYDGLVLAERRQLHARVAAALEQVFSARLREFAEVIAHHCVLGGEVDKAVTYLTLSARKASDMFELDQADEYFRQAYELLTGPGAGPRDADLVVRLILDWSDVLYLDGRLGTVDDLLRRHEDQASRVSDPELRAAYLARAAMAAWSEIDYGNAERFAVEAMELARRHALAPLALPWMIYLLLGAGRADEIDGLGTLPLEPEPHDDAVATAALIAAAFRGVEAIGRGHFARAEEVAAELIDLGQRSGHSRPTVIGLVAAAQRQALCLQGDEAVASARRALEAARDPMVVAWVLGFLGAIQVQAGDFNGLEMTVSALEAHHATRPLEWCESFMRALRGGLDMVGGDLSAGMARVRRELDAREAKGDSYGALFIRIILGQTYVRIALGEVKASVSSVLRNPGFVVRHALKADRLARSELEASRQRAHALGLFGFDPWISFALAQLHAGKKRSAEARRELDACMSQLDEAGVELSALVRELAGRLDVGPAGSRGSAAEGRLDLVGHVVAASEESSPG